MATTTKDKPAVDFERMTQQQAAHLLGVSAVWLRDHPQTRNSDDSYSLSSLVRSMASDFQPAILAEPDQEKLQNICENASCSTGMNLTVVTNYLQSLADAKGAEGMAALGYALLEGFKYWAGRETVAEIQAAKSLLTPARAELQIVAICPFCEKRYRWCNKWRPAPIPKGYESEPFGCCPQCKAQGFS